MCNWRGIYSVFWVNFPSQLLLYPKHYWLIIHSDKFQALSTCNNYYYTFVWWWLVLQFNTGESNLSLYRWLQMNQKKPFKQWFFLFLENPFPDQLVSLSQQPFRSLESFAPSRNVIPKKSIEELKDLCRICQMFTSEKPLECKTHCAKILNDKTSATKLGKNGLCITRRNTLSISTYNSCFIFFFFRFRLYEKTNTGRCSVCLLQEIPDISNIRHMQEKIMF